MVERRWSPVWVARHLRRVIKRPSDMLFALQIGWFLFRAPNDLSRSNVEDFLTGLRSRQRPGAKGLGSGMERITRLRDAWLALPPLRGRSSCYIRALTLYRFLDVTDSRMKFHMGVERRISPGERLHGHAWVTVDDRIVEEPRDAIERSSEVSLHRRLH